jgi:hypothetical protein
MLYIAPWPAVFPDRDWSMAFARRTLFSSLASPCVKKKRRYRQPSVLVYLSSLQLSLFTSLLLSFPTYQLLLQSLLPPLFPLRANLFESLVDEPSLPLYTPNSTQHDLQPRPSASCCLESRCRSSSRRRRKPCQAVHRHHSKP